MCSVVRVLAARGTGPSCLLQSLHGSTAPVRRSGRGAVSITKALGSGFNESIMGRSLYSLFGKRLRLLLECPVLAEGEEHPSGRAPLLSSEPFFDEVGKGPVRFPVVTLTGIRKSRRDLAKVTSIGPNSKKTADNKDIGDNTSGRIERRGVESVLAKQLREYLRFAGEFKSNGVGPEHSGKTKNYRDTRPAMPVNTPSVASMPNSFPEMTGREVARKLQAFASGENIASNGLGQAGHCKTFTGFEVKNVFNIEAKIDGKGESEGGRELSEKVAEILRKQALQHGIDIT